jgi:hypothetical protein
MLLTSDHDWTTAAFEVQQAFIQRIDRQVLGHCGRWFNGMAAAGEDPVAAIQWSG